MNKNTVNQEIGIAYEVLNDVGIAKNGKIDKTFRGQISTFGAAVTMGSLNSAVAFFSNKGESSVDRDKIPLAIFEVLKRSNKVKTEYKNLFEVADKAGKDMKEEIINAAISLKLAMNLYELVKTK